MSDPFPIPLKLVMSGGLLATPKPADVGIKVLRNDGNNEPQWGDSPAAATFVVLTADPLAPDDLTYWVVKEGSIPDMYLSLKARIGGVTYNIARLHVVA